MPYSFVQYVGDGSTRNFNVPFGYLDQSHVDVQVNGVSVAFTWLSASQVQCAVAPANASIIDVRRTTPQDIRSVVWTNAANLTETDLNTADLQVFYIVQENSDGFVNNIQLASDGTFDADGKRISDLANGVNPQDAATKSQVDAVVSQVASSATSAASSATSAAASATAALAAKVLAESAYDDFNDKYLGNKSANPTLDNDGFALLTGALYYNTVAHEMRVYSGTVWQSIPTQDKNVSVSSNDTTFGYLNGKLVNGTGIALTEINDGAAETLSIGLNVNGLTEDTTPDTANDYLLMYDASASAYKKVKPINISRLAIGTAQATTSGTAIDFGSIPSGAKRITVMLDQVSLSGSSNLLLQIGDSGGIENTGYTGGVTLNGVGATSASAGFQLTTGAAAGEGHSGRIVLDLMDPATFKWVSGGNLGRNGASGTHNSGGVKALTAELDRIRLTTVNGTDTFDAGSVNISYQT